LALGGALIVRLDRLHGLGVRTREAIAVVLRAVDVGKGLALHLHLGTALGVVLLLSTALRLLTHANLCYSLLLVCLLSDQII